MERPLTEWELAVVSVLADVHVPGADVVRESIPHLVVSGSDAPADRSFDVRDARHPRAEGASQRLSHGATADGRHRYSLLLDADGRPQRVEDESRSGDDGAPPDPETLVVEADGALPARWRLVAVLAVLAAAGCVLAWSVLNGYGPDTSGKDTCAVQASSAEPDEQGREWYLDRCVDAVPGGRGRELGR